MTVPIYIVALVMLLLASFSSDHFKERSIHIMAMSLFAVVSLAIVAGVKSSPHVRYAFICFGESLVRIYTPKYYV
jgi:hypothetical protein